MKTITFDWLDEQGACWSSLQAFSDLFGNNCEVTQANVRRWLDHPGRWSVRSREDLQWLVLRLVEKKHRYDDWRHSLPLARRILDHLGVEKPNWDTYALRATDAVGKLPKRRLIKAIVQIAEQSPNI